MIVDQIHNCSAVKVPVQIVVEGFITKAKYDEKFRWKEKQRIVPATGCGIQGFTGFPQKFKNTMPWFFHDIPWSTI